MVEKVQIDFVQLQPERLGHEVSWSTRMQRVFRPQWFAMWGTGFVHEVRVHGENQLVGVVPSQRFAVEMTVETLDELLKIARDKPTEREAVALRIWHSNKGVTSQPQLLIPTVTPADALTVLTSGHIQRVLALGQSA